MSATKRFVQGLLFTPFRQPTGRYKKFLLSLPTMWYKWLHFLKDLKMEEKKQLLNILGLIYLFTCKMRTPGIKRTNNCDVKRQSLQIDVIDRHPMDFCFSLPRTDLQQMANKSRPHFIRAPANQKRCRSEVGSWIKVQDYLDIYRRVHSNGVWNKTTVYKIAHLYETRDRMSLKASSTGTPQTPNINLTPTSRKKDRLHRIEYIWTPIDDRMFQP